MFSWVTSINSYTSLQIRELYHKGINNEQSAKLLSDYFELNPVEIPLQIGYKGANLMVMSKYGLMPAKKYEHFTKGKALLEKAISLDPTDLELIYLRYSIQLNAPSFLKYNNNLQEDRNILLANVKATKDKDLYKHIVSFLLVEANLTEQEKTLIH